MKLAFLALPADERRLYIEQAAVRRNISPVRASGNFVVDAYGVASSSLNTGQTVSSPCSTGERS